MIFHYALSLLLMLPYVVGQHETLSKVEQNNPSNYTFPIKTKGSTKIVSEGGTMILKEPSLNLSQEIPLTLHNQSEKVVKTSSVVRKNGVKFTSEELAAPNTTIQHSVQDIKPHPRTNQYTKETTHLNDTLKKNITLITSTTKSTEKPIVYKPTVLSYEALSNMDSNNKQTSLPLVHSSSKTVANQMPPPDDSNSITSKIYSINSGKHPGMIMPIVITILVVPMFVLLGYMAVKRGQEAWKNRHYKRMDFLLDGMYND